MRDDGRQDAVNRGDHDRAAVGERPPARPSAASSSGSSALNGLLAAAGDALARPAGQTSARWQVLAMVEDGDHTVAETARTLGLARQSVQRVADLLEADGLVRYVDNPRHRRARLIRLTERGSRRARRGSRRRSVRGRTRLGAGVGEAPPAPVERRPGPGARAACSSARPPRRALAAVGASDPRSERSGD